MKQKNVIKILIAITLFGVIVFAQYQRQNISEEQLLTNKMLTVYKTLGSEAELKQIIKNVEARLESLDNQKRKIIVRPIRKIGLPVQKITHKIKPLLQPKRERGLPWKAFVFFDNKRSLGSPCT